MNQPGSKLGRMAERPTWRATCGFLNLIELPKKQTPWRGDLEKLIRIEIHEFLQERARRALFPWNGRMPLPGQIRTCNWLVMKKLRSMTPTVQR